VARAALDETFMFAQLAGMVGMLSFGAGILAMSCVWRFRSIARDIETAIRSGRLQ
jgi:hypothetical protein